MTRSSVARSDYRGIAGLVLLLVVVLAYALSTWSPISVILASGTIAGATWPLVRRVREGTFDVLEPIVAGSIMLAVIFGIRPIAMVATDELTYRGQDIRPEFPFVIALGLIGTLAFTGTYEWLRRRRPDPVPVAGAPRTRLQPVIIHAYIALLAGLSLLLFGIHLSRLGSGFGDGLRLMFGGASPELIKLWAGTTEYLSASPILASCAATLIGVAAGWRLNRYRIVLIVLLIAYPLIVFYVSGDRRYMIPTIGVPLIAWMLMSGRRPPRRLLVLAVPVAFAILTAIPFVRWGAAQEGKGGLAAAFAEGIGNPGQAVDRFILGPDTDMFSALAIEVRVLDVPADYFYGRATIGDLLLAPIPHLLIPDKPRTARDELLIRAYGTPCDVAQGGVCDDFSIIGTSYQDLWIPGVAIVMAGIGALSAALWSRWRRSRNDPRLVVVLSAWAVFVPIIFRAGAMPATAWCLYFLVPCLVGVVISIRRASPDLAPPSGWSAS